MPVTGAELKRLAEDRDRTNNWKRWGAYLSERQWGTIREDYSQSGNCWEYFPHDHARSRAYRWGEDGLLGICDRECRLAFALAFWNGSDPILKERLFGLTNSEGNHGEDVKENYFYLDGIPSNAYLKALYKYPQQEYPYARLVEENRRRNQYDREFELLDTGVFDQNRYVDVFIEYAKDSPNSFLIRLTLANRGPEEFVLHVLPTLWFRNTWSWGRTGEGYWPKPSLQLMDSRVRAEHSSLGTFYFETEQTAEMLFTENETNVMRLFGTQNPSPYVKDAFHNYVIGQNAEAVNPQKTGTKFAAYSKVKISGSSQVVLRFRLYDEREKPTDSFSTGFDATFRDRIREADEYYESLSSGLSVEEKSIQRQAYAGLIWTKQFYNYVVKDWLEGDPTQPPLPPERRAGRNSDWPHLYNREIISMPDNWEYPWYASWDLAFHCVAFAKLDPEFAKEQLILLMREWYMHPNGQLPAYEFAFGDVNPPVHAWACWRVYKMTGPRGQRDRHFLVRVFQKLLLNFTWWVNRKDSEGNHLFSGGFLGLDNIGVFDRSKPLPTGGHLEQADGTAWMAFFCVTMLAMSLELAKEDPAYEDIASKFFEHFVAIANAINTVGGTGLWDEQDGFYYDHIWIDGTTFPLRIRSLVCMLPLLAVSVLDKTVIDRLPGFAKRMKWFLENEQLMFTHVFSLETDTLDHKRMLLSMTTREKIRRVLGYLFSEDEFLSPYGIRSLSRYHHDHPYVLNVGDQQYQVTYDPAESTSGVFGGNSNWRGPIWFPTNFLLIEALERYHHFFGDSVKVECPTGSGQFLTLHQAAFEIGRRLVSIFRRDVKGRAPWQGDQSHFADDPDWRQAILFYEYFHGDNGRGLGASHQTGWTALVVRLLEDAQKMRQQALR
jgi:Mannosylglycerate hydrolase MGH1-like glycoside hydrolase domain